ncbi:MAG: hypothetical protein OXF61_01855, partial [Acidimicrobiaceae bacterium]|nr:hypothetical protein [Acidimicrobiaceae bacterium]
MRNDVEPGQVDLASVPRVLPAESSEENTGSPAIRRFGPDDAGRNGSVPATAPVPAAISRIAEPPEQPKSPTRLTAAPEPVSGAAWRALAVASLGTVLANVATRSVAFDVVFYGDD